MLRKLSAVLAIFGVIASLFLFKASRIQQVNAVTCNEDNYSGSSLVPPDGSTIRAGQWVTAEYHDESAIDKSSIVATFQPLGAPQQRVTNLKINDISVGNPGTKNSYAFKTDISFQIPSGLTPGQYQATIYSKDTDQTSSGGDCGFAVWTFNVAPSAAACVASMTPSNLPLQIGQTQSFNLTVQPTSGQGVVQISATSDSPAVTVPSSINPTWGYVPASGVYPGTANISVLVKQSDGQTCSASAKATVGQKFTGPWWQANTASAYGDIFAQNNLTTSISPYCSGVPGCVPQADLGKGILGSGTYNSMHFGAGSGNSSGWEIANTPVNSSFSVANYWSKIIGPRAINLGGGISLNDSYDINSLAVNDVNFYEVDGPMSIDTYQELNRSSAVIFLVKGNLTIKADIKRSFPQAYLAFFVTGNITVDSQVSGISGDPAIDGVFAADGSFSTNSQAPSGINPLYANGIYVALNGFNLQRDLGPDNSFKPAEYFTFDPSLVINAPKELERTNYTWTEVAP